MPSARAASATGGAAACGRGRPGGRDASRRAAGGAASPARRVSTVGRERRRAEEDGRTQWPATRRPRPARPRAARASPPCAARAVVRSRISTPSRWSISCWMTRASRPGRLDRQVARRARRARARGRAIGRSTSTCTSGRLRQPSSAISSSRLDHSISGLTSATIGLSARRGRRAGGAGCRPAAPPGRCRARRP